MREFYIICPSENEAFQIGKQIHEKLKGDIDYIENRILLNCTTGKLITLAVDEGIGLPEFTLNLNL